MNDSGQEEAPIDVTPLLEAQEVKVWQLKPDAEVDIWRIQQNFEYSMLKIAANDPQPEGYLAVQMLCDAQWVHHDDPAQTVPLCFAEPVTEDVWIAITSLGPPSHDQRPIGVVKGGRFFCVEPSIVETEETAAFAVRSEDSDDLIDWHTEIIPLLRTLQ
jgi:hypothetical protein